MLEFAAQLRDELLDKLEYVELTCNVKSYIPAENKELIALAIKRLKEELQTFRFENEMEEICFFRGVMPTFLALYIHEGERMRLDLIMSHNSFELRRSCLDIFYKEKEEFYKKNAEFIEYCKSGKSDLDQCYFLCADKFGDDSEDLICETMKFPLDMVHTVTISMMMAYEVVMPYIERLEFELMMDSCNSTFDGIGLIWTASKTDLTELIYCFKEAGCFNDGNADVKQIAKYFEYVFSIELGNTSSTFQKIMSRKKGQTSYIDKLRNHINRKIDDIDENSLR